MVLIRRILMKLFLFNFIKLSFSPFIRVQSKFEYIKTCRTCTCKKDSKCNMILQYLRDKANFHSSSILIVSLIKIWFCKKKKNPRSELSYDLNSNNLILIFLWKKRSFSFRSETFSFKKCALLVNRLLKAISSVCLTRCAIELHRSSSQ